MVKMTYTYENYKICETIKMYQDSNKQIRKELKQHEHDLRDWSEVDNWDGRENCLRAIEIEKQAIARNNQIIREFKAQLS